MLCATTDFLPIMAFVQPEKRRRFDCDFFPAAVGLRRDISMRGPPNFTSNLFTARNFIGTNLALRSNESYNIEISEVNGSWLAQFNTLEMDPESIQILLDEKRRLLTIQGSSVSSSEDGSHRSSRSFKRVLTIPQYVDMSSLASKQLPNGKLLLIARKGAMLNEKLDTERKEKKSKSNLSSDKNFRPESSRHMEDLQEEPTNQLKDDENNKASTTSISQAAHQFCNGKDAEQETQGFQKETNDKLTEEAIKTQKYSDNIDEGRTENEQVLPQSIERLVKRPVGDEWPNAAAQ